MLRRYTLTLASWIGLAWVYSAAGWLGGVIWSAYQGWLAGVVVFTLRFALSLVLGIGLCATERRAWAAAVGVSTLHLVLAVALAAVVGGRLATLAPTTLSWMTVLAGLTPMVLSRVMALSVVLALVAAISLAVLWKAQLEFDVPDRRSFTVLSRDGVLLSVGVITLDALLAYLFWRAMAA